MKMVEVKVSELTTDALDYLVGTIEKHAWRCPWLLEKEGFASWRLYELGWGNPTPPYSTDWAQGGPIIDREQIGVLPPVIRRISAERHAFPVDYWRAMKQRDEDESSTHGRGPTALTAAMRCYVASVKGATVMVPAELVS
jgi:hypothetical protein